MDLLPQQWRRAHLRLQNAKPASIANGSNEFGAGQIRSHRCNYDGGFDPKPLAEARPQHSRSPLDVKKLKADPPPCSGIRVHGCKPGELLEVSTVGPASWPRPTAGHRQGQEYARCRTVRKSDAGLTGVSENLTRRV